jgi:hypothetical protein
MGNGRTKDFGKKQKSYDSHKKWGTNRKITKEKRGETNIRGAQKNA